MGVARNVSFSVEIDPEGGYKSTLPCPAPGCGADAEIKSSREEGPYSGSCRSGHRLECPAASPGHAPS